MTWRKGPGPVDAWTYLVQWGGPVDAWTYVTKWMRDQGSFPRLPKEHDMDDIVRAVT